MPGEEVSPDQRLEEPEESAPLVFLSYSHDSKDHKQWVASFAQSLVEKGVQVLFDQWDLDPGDDVPKFMERAVGEADRVLMVCTERYVRKADDGKGGVGYEAMIVTGELVKNLGTKKFIPIVRQGGGDKTVPRCVSTRLYIDLSEDAQYGDAFEDLLRELHQAPSLTKPTLGRNPFLGESFVGKSELKERAALMSNFGEVFDDPAKTYHSALWIIQTDDSLAWRKQVRAAEVHGTIALKAWKESHNGVLPPAFDESKPDDYFEHAEGGLAAYLPLIATLVAAAETGKAGFADQLGWIDSILSPDGWERSGDIYWVDFPDSVLFVTQALVGGMLVDVGKGDVAYRLGASKIGSIYGSNEKEAIFQRTTVNGWPKSLTGHCTRAWSFLEKLIESWPWLHDAFGSAEKCRCAVTAYYLLLNFQNFVKLSKDGNLVKQRPEHVVTVSLAFAGWGSKVCDEGYQIFLQQRELIREILDSNGLEDESRFRSDWKLWIAENGRWLGEVFGMRLFGDFGFPHKNLPDDLRNETNRLEL